MIPRQRLQESIATTINAAQGVGILTTLSLAAYQGIHRIQQYLGQNEPNLVEQLTTLPPGMLIGGAAYATAAFILIGDVTNEYVDEQDRKPYKEAPDSPTYKP